MPEITHSRKADIDLVEIWVHIGNDNLRAADALIEEVLKKLRFLLDYPEVGRLRRELGPGIRSVPLGSYQLFYLQRGEDIELIRVIHGSRKMKKSFFVDFR